MSLLLILLALLSVATLLSRKGALVDLVGGGSAPPLIALGIAVGPIGLAYLTAGTLAGLAPAVDVGIAWLSFLIGARVAGADVHLENGDAEADTLARALAFFSAALVAGAVFATVTIASSEHSLLGDHATLLPLLPLAIAFVAVRMNDVEADVDAEVQARRGSSNALRIYAKSVELLALAAAIGAFAIAGELMGIVVVALGLFAALLVHLLARQGTIPPAVAVLGALLLLTGLARLAHVPAAVAGLLAGAAFSLPRGADAVATRLVGTERPMRIVVTVLIAAATSSDLDLARAIIGAIVGIVIVLVHCVVTVMTAPKRSMRALQALPASSLTPILILAGFSASGVQGAQPLLAIAVIALAVRDATAFLIGLVARPRRGAA